MVGKSGAIRDILDREVDVPRRLKPQIVLAAGEWGDWSAPYLFCRIVPFMYRIQCCTLLRGVTYVHTSQSTVLIVPESNYY